MVGALWPGRVRGATLNDPATVALKPCKDAWSMAQERWWDIANTPYNDWLTEGKPNNRFSYTARQVTLTYDRAPRGTFFVGRIDATGLKPNFAYQIKLVGKPVRGKQGWGAYGDDVANERLGYAGRWWCDSEQLNVNDTHYQDYYKAPSAADRHTLYGYLFVSDFVTDASGDAHLDFAGDHSYHVTWSSWQGADTGLPVGVFISQGRFDGKQNNYYGYGVRPRATMVKLFYEYEAGRFQPVVLPRGHYNCRMLLTEESFHNAFGEVGTNDPNGGFWKSVLATEELSATGAPDTNPANDIVFTISAAPPKPGPTSKIGVYHPATQTFRLRNGNDADIEVTYGAPGDVPLVGDWDGDGTWTIGVYRPTEHLFFLRNSNTPGTADIQIDYGATGDIPLVGDWDGNGTWTIGVYRPTTATFYLRNSNTPGAPDLSFTYGGLNEQPVVGDWDGNHTMTIGLARVGKALLRNHNGAGVADMTFTYGGADDKTVIGDWDGNGSMTIGVYRNGVFTLHNYVPASTDAAIAFGEAGDIPLAGNWDGK